MTPEQIQSAQVAAERAERATRFLDSGFWKRDLEPLLFQMQKDAENGPRWSPNCGTAAEDVALLTAYFSGYNKAVEYLVIQLARMVRDGEEAQQRIADEEAKKKKQGVLR